MFYGFPFGVSFILIFDNVTEPHAWLYTFHLNVSLFCSIRSLFFSLLSIPPFFPLRLSFIYDRNIFNAILFIEHFIEMFVFDSVFFVIVSAWYWMLGVCIHFGDSLPIVRLMGLISWWTFMPVAIGFSNSIYFYAIDCYH